MKKIVSVFLILMLLMAICTSVFAADLVVAAEEGIAPPEAAQSNNEVVTAQSSAIAAGAIAEPSGEGAAYDPLVDYSLRMIVAASTGDYEAGHAAEDARNAKIAELGLEYPEIVYDDFVLLAKIIWAEAGSDWLDDQWKMCVGEVVLNRVTSPEFPNTIKEVLEQPGQYYGANSRYFANIIPTERCAALAMRLFNGERVINDPSVVFQANFRQGGGVHTACYDKHLGWTYFCYSRNVSLYN